MIRFFGIFFVVAGCLAALGEMFNLALPTVRWPFETSKEFDFLHIKSGVGADESLFLWFGWLAAVLSILLGAYLLWVSFSGFAFTPITQRRLQRFRSIKRGWISFLILCSLAVLAMLDHLLVGGRALIVKYDGEYFFPAFVQKEYLGKVFDQGGDLAESEADYLLLKRELAESDDNWLVMPLLPYDPTSKSLAPPSVELEEKDGVYYQNGKLYSGLAVRLYDEHNGERAHVRYRYRKGKPDGDASGWDETGERVWGATYSNGTLLRSQYEGAGTESDFLAKGTTTLRRVYYHAAPPLPQRGHLLGTNSEGKDILAYLYGGLQVNFKAAFFYIPLIYLIGITVGLLMGFWGGSFDLAVQRLIEILSNVPYLYVVIILSASVPEKYKGLGIILAILIAFGWMGMTYLMRSSAMKEKSRDYVAASRVLGASTPRLIFKHILPNSVAIIVTLVPFSVSAVILSLTSLDYLGFGLPAEYATWGRLLADGLQNLSKPWLVSSAFFCLVALLILITFVGEAVREAFDPKKFTYYK